MRGQEARNDISSEVLEERPLLLAAGDTGVHRADRGLPASRNPWQARRTATGVQPEPKSSALLKAGSIAANGATGAYNDTRREQKSGAGFGLVPA